MFFSSKMSFLNRVKNILKEDKQESVSLEIPVSKALETVKDRKAQDLSDIEIRGKQLVKEADNLINSLRDELNAVKNYEDVDGIKAAEDIAENFYNSRKIALDNFNPENNTESYEKDLENLLKEFNDINKKEKALVERMKGDASGMAQTVQKLNEKLEEIQRFNEEERKTVETMQELKENSEELEKLKEEEHHIQEKIGTLEDQLREEKEEKKDLESQLEEEVKQQNAWQRKNQLEEEINEIENEIKGLKRTLKGYSSDLDRGLKKLLYQVENKDVEFNGDLTQLKKIREQNFQEIDSADKHLKTALETVESENILEGRQLEDFRSVVNEKPEFQETYRNIQSLKQEKEESIEKIKNMAVMERKEELEKQIEEKEESIEKKENKISDKKTQSDNLDEKLDEKYRQIEQKANLILDADVDINH